MTENAHHKEILEKPSQIGIKVVIVNPRGEVLLLKRNAAAYGDGLSYWDIPGGRVDASVDVDEIIKDYVAQVGSMALEINEKDEEIETKEEEIAGYKKTVRDLELKIKELLRENESLKTSNTKKK